MSINERGVFHYIIKYIMNDRKKNLDTTISLKPCLLTSCIYNPKSQTPSVLLDFFYSSFIKKL